MGCRKCGASCQGQYCQTHRHEQSPGLEACEGCLAPIHPDAVECPHCGIEQTERQLATDGGVVEMPAGDECQRCGGVFVLDRDSLNQSSVRFECATPGCDEVHVVDRETARRRIGAETMETLQ